METLFVIAVMGVCIAILVTLVDGIVAACRPPRPVDRLPTVGASLVLIPVEERRAQRLRFVGAERRRSHLAAVPSGEGRRRA